ncbi:MAG: YggT family protein [Gemmatimonadota bacterium]|nr:YggT family protein [Gemmatimonadota bacterium]
MISTLAALAAFTSVLRSVLLVGGIILAAVATVDWAARTRRISPFSSPARLLRTHMNPRLTGIERQVVRFGGHPSAAPLWALVAYVVLAALLLAALDMLGGLVRDLVFASESGGAGLVFLAVRWTFAFLRAALIVRVVGSYFRRAAASRWLRWSFPATEWMLRPLRRVVPAFGMIDITPILAYFILQLAEGLVARVFFPGMA